MKHFHLILVVLFVHVLVCASAPSPINWKTLPNMYFWANGWVKDGVTNRFFVTDDGDLYKKDLPPDYYVELPPKKVEATKQSKECRFAEDFPEGNWGTNTAGFQLSLRLDKKTFANGEPIMATLLLRNITEGSLDYSTVPVGYSDGPIGFEATSDKEQVILQHSYLPDVMSAPMIGSVFPGTQIKLVERLDKRFDLTNGTYSIQANVRVGDLASRTVIEPILDRDGKWKPLLDSRGFVTNVYLVGHPSNPADVYVVKSAPVTIKIKEMGQARP